MNDFIFVHAIDGFVYHGNDFQSHFNLKIAPDTTCRHQSNVYNY